MTKFKIKCTGGPKCPGFHPGTPLLRTGDSRMWQCPISQALFEVEIDFSEKEITYDAWGQPQTSYKLTGAGDGG